MKRLSLLPVLLLAPLALAIDTAYSPPVGGMTITVPAGQTRSIAVPLIHDSIAVGATLGQISAVGSNYIDDSLANWTAGELSATTNPYYLRIKTGAAAGRVMMVSTSANTTSRVNLTNDGTDLTLLGITTGTSGDAYELVLADTLMDLFGNSTLQGGADAATADNVQVWGGAAWLIFYYNTTRNRWERNSDTGASPTRDNFVLRPDRGIMITRRTGPDLSLRVFGRVPESAPRYFHSRPGVSFLSNGLPVDITLGTLGMQTRALGWQTGSVPSTAVNNADLVQVWGGASWLIFYYDSVNTRWQRNTDTGASPTRDTFNIPAGRPIMIRRLNAGSNALEGVITLPMPYTIN